MLQDLGYEVHVATNMVDFGSMSSEENERFKKSMIENNVITHQIDFERRMGSLKGNLRSITQLRQLFRANQFSFVHVHSPLGGILGRFVAKQFKVPAIYTAHGFHFFKGGPKSGWLVFYPLEWIFSFITDTLITINDEDYALAKKHMHAKKVVQIHGIGVDVEGAWQISKYSKKVSREKIRRELNIPDNAILISSVGELSDRKNHRVVLEALKLLPSTLRGRFHYVIAGTGENKLVLSELAMSFGFGKQFHLLGYRNDVNDINNASDISIFASFREGLGVAGLDATVAGIYLLGSNIRGISDYIKEGLNGNLFDPESPEELSYLIKNYVTLRPEMSHFSFLKDFDRKKVDKVMRDVYEEYNGWTKD